MTLRTGVFVEFEVSDPVEGGTRGAVGGRPENSLLALPGWAARRHYKLAAPIDQLAPNLLPARPYPALSIYTISDLESVALACKAIGGGDGSGVGTVSRGMRSGVFESISETSTPATPPAGFELPERPSVRCGPPAIVVILSQPRCAAVVAEYNRWYSEIHAAETLMLPGFTKACRYRLSSGADQFHLGDPWSHQPYLTVYEIENVHLIAAARQAMAWLKQVSVEFSSPALDVPPSCWTYELVNVAP
jgi:hypothetical protein